MYFLPVFLTCFRLCSAYMGEPINTETGRLKLGLCRVLAHDLMQSHKPETRCSYGLIVHFQQFLNGASYETEILSYSP